MARLPYIEKSELSADQTAALSRDINLYRMLVYSPEGLRRFSGLGGFIRNGSKLDPRLRELVILQIGWLARAPYEWTHHLKIGFSAGVSEADVHGLIAESAGRESGLDPLTRLALRVARDLTLKVSLSDAAFGELREHLDPQSIIELIIVISHYNGVVRFLAALQVDLEDGYQDYLERFPLPG